VRISFKMSRSSEHNEVYKNRETFAVNDQNDLKKGSSRVERTSVDVKTARNTKLKWKQTGATSFKKSGGLSKTALSDDVYIRSLYYSV